MKFFKIVKKDSLDNHYEVFMETREHKEHYVCEYIDVDTPEAKEINELGLTLRSRLLRSNGEFAMLEGTIFNPKRLMDVIVDLKSFEFEEFTGKEYRDGHSILTVEADGYINKYLIYSNKVVNELKDRLNRLKDA